MPVVQHQRSSNGKAHVMDIEALLRCDSISADTCPLWRFALAFYERPGIADILLDAQDRNGADISMMLFCLWQAGEGREVSRDDIAALIAASAFWRDKIVIPMRTLRRSLKENADASSDCYRSAKALELSCEQALLFQIYTVSQCLAPGVGVACSADELAVKNVKVYAAAAAVMLFEPSVGRLAAEMQQITRAAGLIRSGRQRSSSGA